MKILILIVGALAALCFLYPKGFSDAGAILHGSASADSAPEDVAETNRRIRIAGFALISIDAVLILIWAAT